jgi:3-oxoacyl-[acyl-carrier protein] reductase
MNLGIHGKRVLLTGASRGIGMGIAKALAKEGVLISGVARTFSDNDPIFSSSSHLTVKMDITLDDSIGKLCEYLQKNGFWPIDILVNNLGGDLFIKDPFCSLSDWKKLYRLNLEVAIELCNALLPNMIKMGWGRIVNISSIAGMENQGAVPYCTFKAALTAYTRSMGNVIAPLGIVMSAVLPGAVFTKDGYWDTTLAENPDHVKKFLAERQRIGRFGTLEEIGDWVTFLCSNQASFNTGSIIPVDGGQGRGYFGQ